MSLTDFNSQIVGLAKIYLFGKNNSLAHNSQMSIHEQLLADASPYIFALIYDVDARALVLEFLKTPKQAEPYRRVIFTQISHYKEENLLDVADDENLDDLVAVTKLAKQGYIITTYKKEITIMTEAQIICERAD